MPSIDFDPSTDDAVRAENYRTWEEYNSDYYDTEVESAKCKQDEDSSTLVKNEMLRDIKKARTIGASEFITLLSDTIINEDDPRIARIVNHSVTQEYLRKYCNTSDLSVRFEAFCNLSNHIIEMFVKDASSKLEEKQSICFVRNNPNALSALQGWPMVPDIVCLDAEHKNVRNERWRRYNITGPPKNKEPWYWQDVKCVAEFEIVKRVIPMENPKDLRTYAISKGVDESFSDMIAMIKDLEKEAGWKMTTRRKIRRPRSSSVSCIYDMEIGDPMSYVEQKFPAINAQITQQENQAFRNLMRNALAVKEEKKEEGKNEEGKGKRKWKGKERRSWRRRYRRSEEDEEEEEKVPAIREILNKEPDFWQIPKTTNFPTISKHRAAWDRRDSNDDRFEFLQKIYTDRQKHEYDIKTRNKRKTARYANQHLISTFNRSHVFYLLFTDERLTLAFYSRLGITYSRPFDFVNNLSLFVRLLVTLNTQTPSDCGYRGELTQYRSAKNSPYKYSGVTANGDLFKYKLKSGDEVIEFLLSKTVYSRHSAGLNDKATRVFMTQMPTVRKLAPGGEEGGEDEETGVDQYRIFNRNPKFMAIGLHDHRFLDYQHVERYDLESLFYSIYWTAQTFSNGKIANPERLQDMQTMKDRRKGRLTGNKKKALTEDFNDFEKEIARLKEEDKALVEGKKEILSNVMKSEQATDVFSPLVDEWINPLRKLISQGYEVQEEYRQHRLYEKILREAEQEEDEDEFRRGGGGIRREDKRPRSPDPWSHFNPATLDGVITYENFSDILEK